MQVPCIHQPQEEEAVSAVKTKSKDTTLPQRLLWYQPRIFLWSNSGANEATGDPLINKPDNCIRYAFQNVNDIKIQESLDVMTKTATIGALQIDVTGLSETNVPWFHTNKDKMWSQLTHHLGESRVICASNTARENNTGY